MASRPTIPRSPPAATGSARSTTAPPGGESWADVILRIRHLLVELQSRFAGERVWLFSHEAVILAFRYVLEEVTREPSHADADAPEAAG